jgi:hypothetical protein
MDGWKAGILPIPNTLASKWAEEHYQRQHCKGHVRGNFTRPEIKPMSDEETRFLHIICLMTFHDFLLFSRMQSLARRLIGSEAPPSRRLFHLMQSALCEGVPTDLYRRNTHQGLNYMAG